MNSRVFQVLALISALAAGSVAAGPKPEVRPTEFDFGYIPQTSQVAFSFWIHSVGDEPVKITKVLPGCGCTQAPLEKDIIPPGDSARLEIIFDSGRYTSRVVKKPSIFVEGLAEPVLVAISSHVLPRTDSTTILELTPYKLDISQYGQTVRDRGTVMLTNRTDQDLSLTLIAGTEEFGRLSLPEKIRAGESAEVELVLDETALGESFHKSFTIELDDEYHSRYTIPVRRVVRDPNARQLTAPGGGH